MPKIVKPNISGFNPLADIINGKIGFFLNKSKKLLSGFYNFS